MKRKQRGNRILGFIMMQINMDQRIFGLMLRHLELGKDEEAELREGARQLTEVKAVFEKMIETLRQEGEEERETILSQYV